MEYRADIHQNSPNEQGHDIVNVVVRNAAFQLYEQNSRKISVGSCKQ